MNDTDRSKFKLPGVSKGVFIAGFLVFLILFAFVFSILDFKAGHPRSGAGQIDAEQILDILEKNNFVERAILEKPEMIIAALDKWKTIADEKARSGLPLSPDIALAAFNTSDRLIIGDENAPHVIAEFFDYNCGFCRQSIAEVALLVERRPDIQVVIRHFPVITPDSRDVAAIAEAARLQDKGLAFYKAAAEEKGALNRERAIEIAVAAGAEPALLLKDSETTAVLERIQADLTLGQRAGIQGTPAWIIGGKLFSGHMSSHRLEDLAGTDE